MKYKAERDLPDFAREAKTLSPTKLAEMVLNKRNREITPQSITMWFTRNPEIYERLQKEQVEGLPTEKQSVDTSIFENDHFQELPSIKKWIEVLHSRELDKTYIDQKLGNLKNLCRGTIHGRDLVAEGKWCLKHPDRLNFADLLEMNATLKGLGFDTYSFKRELKDFLENVREIPVGKKITVGKHRSFGKYASLFVPMDTLRLMLHEIRERNFGMYTADLFMLKTATRSSATFNALIEDFYIVPNSSAGTFKVFDKGRKSKYPQGHPWLKRIDSELLSPLLKVIGERKSGRVFGAVDVDELRTLNTEMIKKYAPDVIERYPDVAPNHFWRHMFAQHMLRKNEWNYTKVAALGGWTAEALEESYGKPPEEQVREWGEKAQLNVEVVTA